MSLLPLGQTLFAFLQDPPQRCWKVKSGSCCGLKGFHVGSLPLLQSMTWTIFSTSGIRKILQWFLTCDINPSGTFFCLFQGHDRSTKVPVHARPAKDSLSELKAPKAFFFFLFLPRPHSHASKNRIMSPQQTAGLAGSLRNSSRQLMSIRSKSWKVRGHEIIRAGKARAQNGRCTVLHRRFPLDIRQPRQKQ